jgi:hypothetical protein
MTIEQTIRYKNREKVMNYLFSAGLTDEQIEDIIRTFSDLNKEAFIDWVESFNWTQDEKKGWETFKQMLRDFPTDEERAKMDAYWANDPDIGNN